MISLFSWLAGFNMTIAAAYWNQTHKFPYSSILCSIIDTFMVICILYKIWFNYKFEKNKISK